jgi:hypothetical protein
MLGIPIGLAAANAGEWAFHKYILHGLGCKPGSFWSYHWHEHHKDVRRNDHVDPRYRESVWRSLRSWNGQGKEAAALAIGGLAFAPLLPVAPFFVGTVWVSMIRYYRVHKRAHLDSQWARRHLPWHFDHHMGPNQHRNWCVTNPWFDEVVGTRAPYLGTEREAEDQAKRARLDARRSTAA